MIVFSLRPKRVIRTSFHPTKLSYTEDHWFLVIFFVQCIRFLISLICFIVWFDVFIWVLYCFFLSFYSFALSWFYVFDGADDGESTTILQASGRGVCCDKKEVQLSQRLTDGVEAGLRQLAADCLRVFCYSLLPLIWQRMCHCLYYFIVISWRGVKACDSSIYCGL